MAKRKQHSAEFKARVALDALRGELTLAQLATKHGVHPTQVTKWKKAAVEGMSGIFSGSAVAPNKERHEEVRDLHAKIGQLAVENDFLRKASGR